MEISNWFQKFDFEAKHFWKWPNFSWKIDAKMQIDNLLRDELAPQNGDFQAKYGLLEYWIEEEFCQSKNKNDFQQNCEIAKASVWHLILGVT